MAAKKKIDKNLTDTLSEMDVVTPKKTTKKTKPTKSNREIIEVKVKLDPKEYEVAGVMPSLPEYAHVGDIGMDVYATSVEYDDKHDYFIYHTGISAETIEGVACFLMMRSSVSDTDGNLCNGVGLVDPFTYRGEVCFRFKNRRPTHDRILLTALDIWHTRYSWWDRLTKKFTDLVNKIYDDVMNNIIISAPYHAGDKIGQMVFVKVPEVKIKQVSELSETTRGTGGFGSTGKR